MAHKNKKFRRIQPLTAFTIIVASALVVFLIGVGIWKLKGAQNTSVTLSSGEELKYVGLVDKFGRPISGTIYFSNGLSAELDVDEGSLVYSDGTVYYGPLDADYRKHGKGTITWVNGDETKTTEVAYGQMPVPYASASKSAEYDANNNQICTYECSWPELVVVTANATYEVEMILL